MFSNEFYGSGKMTGNRTAANMQMFPNSQFIILNMFGNKRLQ